MWSQSEIAGIISSRQKEVEKLKRIRNVEMLAGERYFQRKTNRFDLKKEGFSIIPELNRKHQGKWINRTTSTESVTRAYAAYFSTAISICTDKKINGGSTDDLISARDSDICLIRHDFIIDEYQVVESKAFGADAIILKPVLFKDKEMDSLAAAAKHLNLDVLFEMQSLKTLDHFREQPAAIFVPINNAASAKKIFKEIKGIAGKIPLIASFEFNELEEVRMIMDAGFNGIKTGAWFMKQASPVNAIKEFSYSL